MLTNGNVVCQVQNKYIYFFIGLTAFQLIPVVTRSKTYVCGRWLAGIAGSNPAGGVDVFLL